MPARLSSATVVDRFIPPPAHAGYGGLKRALDVTIAVTVPVVLPPVWLAIACAFKLTSPRPVVFIRAVVGRGGNALVYHKFRTLRHNNDDSTHRAFLEYYVRGRRQFVVETDRSLRWPAALAVVRMASGHRCNSLRRRLLLGLPAVGYEKQWRRA